MKKHILKQKKRKWALIILAVLAFVLCVWVTIAVRSGNDKQAFEPGSVADVSGPTDEEKNTGDAQKEQNQRREQTDQEKTGIEQKKNVTPIITYVQQTTENLEVGAFLSDTYESGGTCTLIAVRGTNQLTAQTPAEKGATTTNCQTLRIPLTSFPEKGTWNITVKYESSVAAGSSTARSIDVK